MCNYVTDKQPQLSGTETAVVAPRHALLSSYATLCLIALNVVVFFVLPTAFGNKYPSHLDHLGADWGPLTLSGQWWRLLTSTFVHIQLFHLLFNMIGLWILGNRIEGLWGHWTFLLFYFSCAFVGDITVLATHPEVASYGASVGVLGIAGAVAAVYAPRFMGISWGARFWLGTLILYSAYIIWPELSGGLYVGHTVGFLTGAIIATFFTYFARTPLSRYWTFVGISVLLTVVAIIIRQHYHARG